MTSTARRLFAISIVARLPLPMLSVGTIAGALLGLDNALDLDLTSFLYPVWQACVAVGLATALRRTRSSLDVND